MDLVYSNQEVLQWRYDRVFPSVYLVEWRALSVPVFFLQFPFPQVLDKQQKEAELQEIEKFEVLILDKNKQEDIVRKAKEKGSFNILEKIILKNERNLLLGEL